MTLTGLAVAHLRASPLTSALNVALLALGTASIVVLLLLAHQISNTLTRDAEGIDLVLGAKGSPVQLVLSAVYHADIPTGNIPLDEAQRWAADSRVARGIPLSLGDSVRGFRIVGTTPAYADLYDAEPVQGRLWNAPLEAVLGARVADAAGLALGDTFVGAHGLSGMGDRHDESLYRVVGVLGATGAVIDRLVLTSLESVWAIHDAGGHAHRDGGQPAEPVTQTTESAEGHDATADHDHDHDHDHEGQSDDDHGHHDEGHGDHHDGHDDQKRPHEDHADEHAHAGDITAMLLQYNTPLAATSLPRQINRESNLAAAAPAFELARLLQVIGLGLDALRVFAAILIITAAFSIFGALYGALNHRRGDLAMMRCLGATRGTLMASLLIEGLLLTAAGALLGVLVGHVIVEGIGQALASARGVRLTGWILLPAECALLAGLLVVGLLAAALPAWQAYRTDVSMTLSRSS